MAVSLLNLKRAIARDSGLGYASGTATSGSTTTIIDTSADSPFDTDDSSSLFVNAWAMIEADSAATPLNVGEVRRIDATGYNASTQTLTTRAFSNAVSSTQSFAVYMALPPTRVGLHRGLDDFINECLRNSFYKTLVLLTEATDGDMETSGVTNWSVTNATRQKVTTGAGVTHGDQALEVTTTAANGYATMAAHKACSEGEVWDICVDCTPTSGIWKLQAWDVTASAQIDVTTAYAGVQARRLWLRATIPTDCEQFNVRLIGETNTTVAVFDNLTLRNVQNKFLSLPSWFTDRKWLEEVWIYPPGAKRDDAYAIGEYGRYYPIWFGVQESYTDNTPFKLELDSAAGIHSGSHIFIEATRPYAELSADADTTDADQDFVKYMVLMFIFHDRDDKKNATRCAARFQSLNLGRHVPKLHPRRQMGRAF